MNSSRKLPAKIAVYGGNGFVGCHVMQFLHQQGAEAISVSRTGHCPAHLNTASWAQEVTWQQGDAAEPDLNLLQQLDAVVCVVGSPPLPTFTQNAYHKQLHANGVTNATTIAAAGEAGVRRVVLLGAKIPSIMDSQRFAYARGKKMALQAARSFSELKGRSAVVIQPGGLFGTRHTTTGKPIPIGWVLAPLAKIIPSQLIAVTTVAERIAFEALGGFGSIETRNDSKDQQAIEEIAKKDRFNIITHEQIKL